VAGIGYPDRNSLAFDDKGQPWVGYYDAARGVLRVAHRENSKWVSEVVDSDYSGFTNSMQIDRGTIFISYTSESSASVKTAQRKLGGGPAAAISRMAPASGKRDDAR
jgi:hypothetical protein